MAKVTGARAILAEFSAAATAGKMTVDLGTEVGSLV